MSPDVILVTGVTGLIGNAVARRLTREGRTVVGMDRTAPADLDMPMILHDLPDAHRWHEAIVAYGVTHVVHAGGISGPMLLRDAPGRICDINVAGLIGLLEAARIHKLQRTVWFSSVMAYGDRPDLLPVPENTPLLPTTVYGATKAAGEALIRAYRAEHGVDAVSLRVTSCYGPGRTTSCLIRALVEDGLAGRPTLVRSIPGRTRQHIFVEDVAAATCAALDTRTLPQPAYNIGPGRAQSLADIVDQVRVAVPAASAVMHEDGLAWNTFVLGPLLIDAARRDLRFEPTTTLASGAAQTRKWIEERLR